MRTTHTSDTLAHSRHSKRIWAMRQWLPERLAWGIYSALCIREESEVTRKSCHLPVALRMSKPFPSRVMAGFPSGAQVCSLCSERLMQGQRGSPWHREPLKMPRFPVSSNEILNSWKYKQYKGQSWDAHPVIRVYPKSNACTSRTLEEVDKIWRALENNSGSG